MQLDDTTPSDIGVGAYLCCSPSRWWGWDLHRFALRDYARRHGLRPPDVYADDGCCSEGALPELERLVRAVEAGDYQVILLSGRCVPSVCSADAELMARIRGASGCDIVEVPPLFPGPSRAVPATCAERPGL
ncbi:recombinase family protein [Streptomyces actinomycinicus]|uniref:Recombinase family protein n=1 Tax=Streptomyces actinomycinicus TaxID=1695166 RepID=A0A937JT97_9ACTN|nr:recombinase family protein [Streptomyces actinomycinicus]MBL1087567.1 recombinase family protein [Streptomyces actinomycinicus]